MRLALISDLHGNQLALESVLADAGRVGYDELVCLGDVATLGPRPSAVLARLRDLGCRCLLGNHDEFMFVPELARSYSDHPLLLASIESTRAALSADEIGFIQSFQPTLALERVFLYHGTPRSNTEDLLATTPAELVDAMLAGERAAVLAGGHTHLQMLRQHRGMLIVNTGSLGQPFEEYVEGRPPRVLPHAEYAIIETRADGVSVDLRHIELDRTALARQIDGWDNPLAAWLRSNYS